MHAGEAKEDKGATQDQNNLPKNIRLRATLLMNIRPSPGIHVSDLLFEFQRFIELLTEKMNWLLLLLLKIMDKK